MAARIVVTVVARIIDDDGEAVMRAQRHAGHELCDDDAPNVIPGLYEGSLAIASADVGAMLIGMYGTPSC